jgi:hypothetical protein
LSCFCVKKKVIRKKRSEKVKSWRDAGDTPYRKNNPEEAKL